MTTQEKRYLRKEMTAVMRMKTRAKQNLAQRYAVLIRGDPLFYKSTILMFEPSIV